MVRLHPHPVLGGAPRPISSNASAIVADTPALPFSRRKSVPRSQPRRAAVSVTFQPRSSMLSRISSPSCGGFRIGSTRSLAMSFVVSTSFGSVVVDQVHGLTVLEAEHCPPVAGDANSPPASAVALQGMQPKTRRVGAARMRRFLQQDALKRGARPAPCQHVWRGAASEPNDAPGSETSCIDLIPPVSTSAVRKLRAGSESFASGARWAWSPKCRSNKMSKARQLLSPDSCCASCSIAGGIAAWPARRMFNWRAGHASNSSGPDYSAAPLVHCSARHHVPSHVE